jgi:hypothetical protein
VSGTLRRGDGVHVRIVGDAPPDPGARPAEVTLEDAYLWHMGVHREAAAAAGGSPAPPAP